jgi:carboxypeptidase PM20D1
LRRWLLWPLAAIGIALLALVAVLAIKAYLFAPAEDPPVAGDAFEIDGAAAARRLSQAIAFETLSQAPGDPVDPQAFLAFHSFLEASYPLVHQRLEREIVNDFSLVYRWPGSDPQAQPILLIAHQDVVPPNGEWSKPPFSGLIEDGFIWGRGTLDDKVSVLGILDAVELLLERGFTPRRTVYLAFGHDEEIDGRNGAQAMASRFRDAGLRFAFVLDEGSPLGIGLVPGLAGPAALLGTAEKGYLSVELNASTSGGHSSMPSRASAVRVLAEGLLRLWENADQGRLEAPFTDTLDALAPQLDFLPRLLVANHWLFEPLLVGQLAKLPETNAMISTTGTVTILEAGQKDNVMPSHARAVINFRLLPGTTAKAQLERVVRVLDDPEIAVRQLGEASDPAPLADLASESYRQLKKSVRQVFPDAVVLPTIVIAATDSRHYVGVADAVYRFLPTRLAAEDLTRMHGLDERIAIDNYVEIIRFYAQLLLNTAG